MNISTRHRKVLYTALGVAGLGYFAAFSQLQVSTPFIRAYAAGVPIQLAALIYVALYLRHRRLSRRSSPPTED